MNISELYGTQQAGVCVCINMNISGTSIQMLSEVIGVVERLHKVRGHIVSEKRFPLQQIAPMGNI